MSGFGSQLLADLWHGALWKVLSLASRAWFLLVIFPILPGGTLGNYMFFATASLIGGRVLAGGLDLELPILIRGGRRSSRRWLGLYAACLMTAIVALLLSFAHPGTGTASILLAIVYAGHNVLSGIVRSVRPHALELLGNLHPVAFALLATVPMLHRSTELILATSLSLLASQLVVLSVVMGRDWSRWPAEHVSFGELFGSMKRAVAKMLTNITLSLSLRGIVIWPKLLLGVTPSDTFGFAVAAGEGLAQFGMIIVNRSYARFCRIESRLKVVYMEVLGRAAILLFGFVLIGFTIGIAGRMFQVPLQVDWISVGVLLLMYGPLCCIQLIRYALWAGGWNGNGFVWIFTLWIVAQVATVLLLQPGFWPLGMAVSSAVALVIATRIFLSAFRQRATEYQSPA